MSQPPPAPSLISLCAPVIKPQLLLTGVWQPSGPVLQLREAEWVLVTWESLGQVRSQPISIDLGRDPELFQRIATIAQE